MGTSVQPTIPHVLTGDEWEQQQYAPHRVGQDPTKPAGTGRILTGDEWEKAQSAASTKTLTFPTLPKIAPDVTATRPTKAPAALPGQFDTRLTPEQQAGSAIRTAAGGLDAAAGALPGEADIGAHALAAAGRQVIAPAVENPALTAAMFNPIGGLIGAGMAVHTIAKYGWQTAHEAFMSPEDRAKAQADPDRVSGEAAAVQAIMLGLGGLAGIHAGTKAAEASGIGDVGAGVVESAAADMARASAGTAPSSPEIQAAHAAEVAKTAAREPLASPVVPQVGRQAEETPVVPGSGHAEEFPTVPRVGRGKEANALTEEQRTGKPTPVTEPETFSIGGEPRIPERTPAAASRRPFFQTVKGAETLGTAAGAHGMPETASPFPPGSVLDRARLEGHATAAPPPTSTGEAPPGPGVAGSYTIRPSVAIRDETGALRRNLSSVSTEDLKAEWQRLAELSNTEEALHAGVQEAGYRANYEELPSMEKSGRSRRNFDEFGNKIKKQAEDLPDAGGEVDADRLAADNKIVADYNRSQIVRAARAKAMARIEAEIQKRPELPDFQLVANAYHEGEPGQRPLAPIEGTGATKTRGLALGVEAKAIAKDLTDYLGDLPEYRQVNMADQAARSATLISENPDLARRVALGEERAPEGILPEAVFTAVENRAIEQGDVATIRDLASSKLTEEATTMGQRIRALAERDPDSPVSAIQRIEESRAPEEGGEKAIGDAVAELQQHIEKGGSIDEGAWTRFIDSLRC